MEGKEHKLFLAFIRHGERADQVKDEKTPVENEQDPPLTTNGKAQAKKTGEFLKKVLEEQEIKKVIIYSSPFLRAL